ncbi:hypothetical protein SESBI_40019 [Sesbania bispinosa]|nr:hypothetical protein SESBI_40019 [Sesbania bispinosa]
MKSSDPLAPKSDHQASGFWLCHPPTFDEGLDRSSATTCLRKIKEILDAKGYPDEQGMSFASLMLKGEAMTWWMGAQGRAMALDTTMT